MKIRTTGSIMSFPTTHKQTTIIKHKDNNANSTALYMLKKKPSNNWRKVLQKIKARV